MVAIDHSTATLNLGNFKASSIFVLEVTLNIPSYTEVLLERPD